jgi:hypothetical protein
MRMLIGHDGEPGDAGAEQGRKWSDREQYEAIRVHRKRKACEKITSADFRGTRLVAIRGKFCGKSVLYGDVFQIQEFAALSCFLLASRCCGQIGILRQNATSSMRIWIRPKVSPRRLNS